MNVARVLLPSTCHPRVALERDGALYDVEALERELGSVVEVPGPAWDFHTRVVALGMAGLRELDAHLLKGRRPSSSRVDLMHPLRLPPCDPLRAGLVHVDVEEHAVQAMRLGSSRTLAGPGAFIALPSDEVSTVEVRLAVLLGEDLHRSTRKEARAAALGLTLYLDWSAASMPAPTTVRLPRGLHGQLGPSLLPLESVGRWAELQFEVAGGGAPRASGKLGAVGVALEDALQFASAHLPLSAGDLVTVGPLARTSSAHHVPVTFRAERLGELSGTAVEAR